MSIIASRWLLNVYRQYVPPTWRWQIHLFRWLGPVKFLSYRSITLWAKWTVRQFTADDGIKWYVPGVGLLHLGDHSTSTLRAHWIQHAQPIKELQGFVRWARGRKIFLDVGA